MSRYLLLALLLFTFNAFGQKLTIDPSCYNDWNRIGDILISPDGAYSAYTIRPLRGDGYLYIVNNETGKKDSVARGLEPQFSGNGRFLAFKINPGFDTMRNVELKKINKDKWPKDSLGIWILAKDSLIKIPKVKDFKLAVDGDWIAYLSTSNEWPKDYLTKREKKKEAKLEMKKGVKKTDGKLLTIWHPDQVKAVCYRYVTHYEISRNGESVAFLEQEKFKKDSVRFVVASTNMESAVMSHPPKKDKPIHYQPWKHPQRFTEVSQLSFSYSNNKITGLYTTDTTEQKRWNLFVFDRNTSTWETIVDTVLRFETDRMLSSNYRPRLLEDDQTLFFGVWNAPEKPFKDTLLENEKVKLDLWHWKDARMQPQQLVELKSDQTKYNLYAYHFADKSTVQIGRDSLRLRGAGGQQVPYVLAACTEAYEGETWRSPLPANYYRIATSTGELRPLKTEAYFGVSLSPSGKYFTYYNDANQQQYVLSVDEQQEHCMTCDQKANWYEDINGMPTVAGPQGTIGWTAGEQGVLVQSESDIWYYDLSSHKLSSFTVSRAAGNVPDTNYHYAITNLKPDSTLLYADNLLITQFDKRTKAMKLFRLSGSFPNPDWTLVAGSDHDYLGFKQAKKSSTLLFQRQSVAEYPDLYVSTDLKKEPKTAEGSSIVKISETNPQQKNYNWATVELIDWKSYDGIPLSGLLYKPENYDPNKSYPLLVYYYELYSDDLHKHYAPKPTASIIYPTEYASAGYLVFIPDIRYKAGHPAKSAYDCIMSGTDAVIRKYPNIDSKRMGLQGQSWGGYQTAQLITMTNRFAAAMAGAPVGNMFSAYGGIRWGSGYSRQFQYEHTQSRIGKTIWEAPELYMENSPIFHLPKVTTPLLIMHNDQDGAVPWYQGIELYAGLRRLGKPVWLLNYNGDDHNLMKNPNRMDLSIRMRQFFDYYLLGQPMPLWLKDGIPAIEKGKDFRLQTIDE